MNLKQLREKANISQIELAKNAGINVRTLQQYEQGTRDLNKAGALTILKLAFVLDCDPYELINWKIDLKIKTSEQLEKYAKIMLPDGIALCINKNKYQKPQAPNGEKYTLYYKNTLSMIHYANNIEDAKLMIDTYNYNN